MTKLSLKSKNISLCAMLAGALFSITSCAVAVDENAAKQDSSDENTVASQDAALEANTRGLGFGPQAPRDIDQKYGLNKRSFSIAPNRSELNLCNIHFHKNAEHRGGQFTTPAGNSNGSTSTVGFVYNGTLSASQLESVNSKVCAANNEVLKSGDTIEVHYVFSSAQVQPGPTLGACLSPNSLNPELRVEAQVMVLANDNDALDFGKLAEIENINGYFQAPNIPTNTGIPVEYTGSTTGPSYNENASPFKVTWSVRPEVAVVNINSVGEWCKDNVFDEDHAHKSRNLVQNPHLLSPISH